VSLRGSGQKNPLPVKEAGFEIKMVNAYLRRRSKSWCPFKPLLEICFLSEVFGEAFMG
jgi:hypothetical protein